MTLLVVLRRTGVYASLNQRYHVALIGWWRIYWRKTP